MSENAPGMAPTDHHERLMQKVGDWKVQCLYFMNPTDPIAAEGTDRVEAIGPFWTMGHFECTVMGNPIRGLSTTGFDPKKEKYTATWQDSVTPFFYYFEGDLSEDGKTLELEGDNVDPTSGNLVVYRSIETIEPDARTLKLFIDLGEDKQLKILEYAYTRM